MSLAKLRSLVLARLSALARACAAARAARPSPSCRRASTPSVEVGAPLKSDAWKQVATAADEDRIARLGLAWQEALAEARKTNRERHPQAKACCSGRAPALPRPAPTPGSYNCRLIKLGKATAKSKPFEKLQAVLLLRRGRGRPADHRQADRQPAAGRPAVGGRRSQPPGLPRQPGARRRADSRWPMATIPSATWPACSSGSRRSTGGW